MDKYSQKTCDPLLHHYRSQEFQKTLKYFKTKHEDKHGVGTFHIPKRAKYLFRKTEKKQQNLLNNHWKWNHRSRHTIGTVCLSSCHILILR